jgi:predicted DNA-binding transcriptional regulator AlpA
MAAGSFPKQIALGIRAVGWLESEIDQWLALRISARQIQKT